MIVPGSSDDTYTENECMELACDKLGFKYDCTGTGYAGGAGTACGGKYTQCTCASGYKWNGSSCKQLNGAQGELYYCKGKVVGVKTSGMKFYVAMKDLGLENWPGAMLGSRNYLFCGNIYGTLPTAEQLKTIYNNKSSINSLLSANGGTRLVNSFYWSSTTYDAYDATYYYSVSMKDGDSGSTNLDTPSYYARPIMKF